MALPIADSAAFATFTLSAMDMEELVPYARVVCVPPQFHKSLRWGDPDHYIQFVNYTKHWNVRYARRRSLPIPIVTR